MTDELDKSVEVIERWDAGGTEYSVDGGVNWWTKEQFQAIQALIDQADKEAFYNGYSEGYKKGYIDGGIGVMNGELPFKRQFMSKKEISELQEKNK